MYPADELPFLFQARSVVVLTVKLAHDHPADLLSFIVLAGAYFYDGGASLWTKSWSGGEKRSQKEGKTRVVGMLS